MSSDTSTGWQPRDPAYEARVRESFGRQSLMTTLGATIAFVAPGHLHLARPGRTLTVCRADVFTTGAADRVLIATMLSTIIVRPVE